jgi:hypothetical protein
MRESSSLPLPPAYPQGHEGEGWGEGGATRKRDASSKPSLHPHPRRWRDLSRRRERWKITHVEGQSIRKADVVPGKIVNF